ncbi:MAG: hypothetical protein JXR76_21245 [Deltaproteobacteria bacterium]|nr:hypothetical protein [Deltaproteobacteria bacterium]
MIEKICEVAFEKCFGDFMALQDEQVTFCRVPIDTALAEARTLTEIVTEDYDALIGAGLNPLFLITLPDRAYAFMYAAIRYKEATATDPDALLRWKTASQRGYDVRNYLVRFLSFAFRDAPELLKEVDTRVLQGRSHKDMIMDLLALSVLAENNPRFLERVPLFDRSKIAEAKELHISLGILLEKSSINPEKASKAKNILNRAYTWYKIAADEIKIHGQYLFQGTGRVRHYGGKLRGTPHRGERALATIPGMKITKDA